MRQLLLDLLPPHPPTLANFVVGSNGEAVAAYTDWLEDERSRSLHLWGETAAGKSHLLSASGYVVVDAASNPDLAMPAEASLLAVDNVERLSPGGQIALFNFFNRLSPGGKLLTAAPEPPAHLQLREDLRTRLGSGLICRLRPLSDAEKAAALTNKAAERGMKLPEECLAYLLRHCPRDLRSLTALLVALDRYSLEHKRSVTLPLLREVLQENRS